ncbi:YihY/virulence factor BrkB family protein [Microbacterium radiodurans]|uniref:YihY/virulence factor BrkB family protein n=1 Tax=Microbacterium radiodurans TaxID=661398 RepID=A0A5J5IU62_9MICO|nr:YhjD/YihY/BrkB family envelope integrity protein [Microbacterium radiodurans]KAA9087203.1 YihY/virulence factor BrkB family protein [Microbacterium radiodurans]
MAETTLIARVTAGALQRKPVRAFLRYSEHRGAQLADSVTYRTLFSLFAGVLLGFSVAALWLAGNPSAWQALIDSVNRVVPGLVGSDGLIKLDAISAPAGLTIAGVIAVVGLLGSAIGAIGSLRLAMRSIADELTDDVLFVWVLLRNLGLAIAIGGALVAAAAVTFVGTAGIGILADLVGLSDSSPAVLFGGWFVSLVVVFALDTVAIAVLFRVLSGVRASRRALWSGALLGGAGLTVLQQLSGLFVGGASSNPLIASFASLIALLLWLNLSSQVILIATAYIVTGVREEEDRVRSRFGARTFAQRRVQRAEESVAAAARELQAARVVEEKERRGADA